MTEDVDPESLQQLREMYTIFGVSKSGWQRCWRALWCRPWHAVEAVEVAAYLILGTAVSLTLGMESRDREVEEDNKRKPLAVLACIGGPLTALIGVLFMKLRSTLLRGLLIFLFLWLLPLCTLFGYIYSKKYEVVPLVVLAYLPACVTYFAALHSVRLRLTYVKGRTFGSAITTSICALGPFWGVCFAIYEIVSTAEITTHLVKKFVQVLAVPFLLCLVLAWAYLHFVFFVKYNSRKDEEAAEMSRSIPPLAVQLEMKENPHYFDPPPPGCWTSFQEKAHLISSLVQLCTLLGIEIGLLSLLVRYVDGDESESVLYVVAFYIPALPFFTYVGILFSGSSLNVADKYWSGALIGVAIPLICIYPATHWLRDQGVADVLAWIVSVSYPASVLYWLSMSLLYEHDKRSYQLLSAFMCVTVLVPVGVLIPLYKAGGIKLSTFWATFSILCVVKLYTRVIGAEEADLSQILIHRETLSKTEQKAAKRLRRYQKILPVAGVVFILVVIIPMLAASGLADEEVAGSLTVFVLVVITVGLTVFLLDIKWKLQQYGPKFMSFCLGCCWCMVVIPLVCLVPTTLAVSDSNKDLQMISSWTIGFTCILCMLGVSSLSIVVNYVFKRMEYEKLAKYCCRKLQKLLRDNGVLSRMPLLRTAFDHFYYSSESAFEEVLKEATYITHRELAGDDKPPYFSKELLTIEDLTRIAMKRKINGSDSFELTEDELRRRSKGKRKKRSCKQLLISLCSTQEQDEIPIFVDQLLPAELSGQGAIPEDNEEIEFEDRPIDEQVIISKSFNPAKYQHMFEEAEQEAICQSANKKPLELHKYFGTMVLGAIKTQKETEQKQPEVKDIVARNRDFLLLKMMEHEEGEPEVPNEDLTVTRVKGKARKKLLQSRHFQSLKDDPDKRKEWFRLVYKRFAHGEPGRDKEIWTTLHDLRQFVRIVSDIQTGLETSPQFINVAVDIMYVRMTRRFNASRSVKTFRKVNFDVFYDDLLKLMARVKYPKLPLKEAEVKHTQDRLFEKWIYPNLVGNLPYLGVADKPKHGGLKINPLLALLSTNRGDTENHGTEHDPPLPVAEEAKTTEEGFTANVFRAIPSPVHSSRQGPRLEVKDLENGQKTDFMQESVEAMDTGKWTNSQKRDLAHGETWAPKSSNTEFFGFGKGEKKVGEAVAKTEIEIDFKKDVVDEREKMPYEDGYDRCWKKFSQKVTECLLFVQILCKLLAKCLFPYDKSADKLLIESEAAVIDEDELPQEAKDNPAMRKPSPDWLDLCHLITTSLTQFLEEAKKILLSKPIQKMELNSENLIAILAHISDVISMASIAFAKEVGWTDSDSIASNTSRVVLAETSYWTLNYWVCFFFCVLFAGLSIPAIRLAKSGRYGVNNDMRPVKALSWPGLLSRAVSLLAVSLYMTIMKTQLDALSCIYDDTTAKWALVRNSDIQCFSAQHATYFTMSVLVICVYYPLATLLYPNIQYQNKGLDLKYNTTYVVLEAQGKLAIVGFAAFLPREKYLKMQLIVCICVNWLLGIIVAKTKPCLVKSYNLWKSGGYFVIGWCGFWALMNVIAGGEQLFCLVLLVIGVGVMIVILSFLQFKLYGWTFRKQKVKPLPEIEIEESHEANVEVRPQPTLEAQPGPSNPFRDLLAHQSS